MTLASLPTGSRFSLLTFVCMLMILAVSAWVLRVLIRSWTTNRPMQALRDWAADRRFSIALPPDLELPSALEGLKPADPRVELYFRRKSTLLLRLTTVNKPTNPRPVWHLLICESPLAWNPAGLRPVNAERSLLDLFALNAFPSLLPPERFVAMGIDSRDAKRIAASPARGLLPADIGLMVHGPYLTLDFSARPFDAIEFDRMLIIMEQVLKVLSDGAAGVEGSFTQNG